MAQNKDHKQMMDDLEEDINVLEDSFEEIEDDSAEGDLKDKQEQAKELLKEIHQQLDYLKDAANKDKQ